MVTVDVRKFLEVLCHRDPVADRVRKTVPHEQLPTRGASAHDEVVEDEDRHLFDVPALRLEGLLGRQTNESTGTLALIGVGDARGA